MGINTQPQFVVLGIETGDNDLAKTTELAWRYTEQDAMRAAHEYRSRWQSTWVGDRRASGSVLQHTTNGSCPLCKNSVV